MSSKARDKYKRTLQDTLSSGQCDRTLGAAIRTALQVIDSQKRKIQRQQAMLQQYEVEIVRCQGTDSCEPQRHVTQQAQ